MKQIQALVAAVIITGLVGLGMLAVGVNALLNPNTVAASNTPGDAPTTVSASSPDAQAPSKQLQNLVAQYQDREKQYQAQIKQLQDLGAQYQDREKQVQAQLNQTDAQLQQVQQLLVEMQRRGLIRINGDGSVQLPRRGAGGGG